MQVNFRGAVSFLIAFSAGLLIGAQWLGSATNASSLGMKRIAEASASPSETQDQKSVVDFLKPFIKDMQQARDDLRLETAEIRESEQALRGVATHLPEVARLASKEVGQATGKLKQIEVDLQTQISMAALPSVSKDIQNGVHEILDAARSTNEFVTNLRQDANAHAAKQTVVPEAPKGVYLAEAPPGYTKLGSGVCANNQGQRVQYCQQRGKSFEDCRRKCDSMRDCTAFNPDSHQGSCFIHYTGTWDGDTWAHECHAQGTDSPVFSHDGSEGGTCWKKNADTSSECDPRQKLHLKPWSSAELKEGVWQKTVEQTLTNHPNTYVINIGAADGVKLEDPTAFFLTRPNAKGLACEYDPIHKPKLLENYPSELVTKIFGPVTPDNVLRTFTESEVPVEPLVLKVDIDGYDADVTTTILNAHYRPRIIVVEHNEKFPPGFYFKIRYNASLQWSWHLDHIYGNSAEVWAELFDTIAPEYVLLGVLANQMVWAHSDVIKESGSVSLYCAYGTGYLFDDRRAAFDMSRWLDEDISHQERLLSMQTYLAQSKTRQAIGADYPIELRLSTREPKLIRGSCDDSLCSASVALRET